MELEEIKKIIVEQLLTEHENDKLQRQDLENLIDELNIFVNLIVDYIVLSEYENLKDNKGE